MLCGGEDLGNAGFVVGAQQSQAVGDDDVIAYQLLQAGEIGHAHHHIVLFVEHHIAAVVFHSNSAAGHGQRVADQSIGVELPTGMEGDVIRNCGIFHIKALAIFGVPAGELVTRTGGIMDGSQFVCLGISDFFGLINRHLSGAVQAAALGIKGHMAEAKKLVSCQCGSKLIMCGVLVFVGVDDTFRPTIFQTVIESSQSSREYNVFQFGAICKGLRVNDFYLFRDGDGLEF